MGFPTIYVDTGGAATNSGSSDSNAASLAGSAATVTGSVVFLDGTPNLSAVDTGGGATIHLNDATNSNQKIFQITAVSDTGDNVTVATAPTGITSSAWAIGGRFVWTNSSLEGALAAGWDVQFNNSPANHSGSAFLTCRASGDDASGKITVRGDTGVARPVITVTDDNNIINGNSQTDWLIENLELTCTSAGTSDAINGENNAEGWFLRDVKVTDAPDDAIRFSTSDSFYIENCEVGAVGGTGFDLAADCVVFGCYAHDCGNDGFLHDGSSTDIHFIFCISDNVGGDAFDSASTTVTNSDHLLVMLNCIAYSPGDAGLEIGDVGSQCVVYNCVFMDCPDVGIDYAGGEPHGSFVIRGNNIFHNNTSGDIRNGTLNSTEITQDPLFNDAANGDFSLATSSPARQAGWPGALPGGLSTGYLDIGSVQAQEPTNPVRISVPMALGDVHADSTVQFFFNSYGLNGESADVTGFAVGDVAVYKDGSETERTSTSGYTIDANFDAKTGQGIVQIDLSDNTDAGFYVAGSHYAVCVEGITLGSQTVRACIGQFRIVPATAVAGIPDVNVTHWGDSGVVGGVGGRPTVNAGSIADTGINARLNTLDTGIRNAGLDVDSIDGDTGAATHLRQWLADDTGLPGVDVRKIHGDTGSPPRIRLFAGRLDGEGQIDTGTFDSTADKGVLNRVADRVWDEPDTGHNVAGTMGRHQQQGDTGSAQTIVRHLMDAAEVDGLKFIEAVRAIAAATAGTVSGAGTGTETFIGLDDVTQRLVATVDSSGNRTAINRTLDTA